MFESVSVLYNISVSLCEWFTVNECRSVFAQYEYTKSALQYQLGLQHLEHAVRIQEQVSVHLRSLHVIPIRSGNYTTIDRISPRANELWVLYSHGIVQYRTVYSTRLLLYDRNTTNAYPCGGNTISLSYLKLSVVLQSVSEVVGFGIGDLRWSESGVKMTMDLNIQIDDLRTLVVY